MAVFAPAASSADWGVDASRNWWDTTSLPSTWVGNVPPDGPGAVANFVYALTADRAATIDDAGGTHPVTTVGGINFCSAGPVSVVQRTWTLAAGSGALVLDAPGTAPASISAYSSANIGAALQSADGLSLFAESSRALTITGSVGGGGLVKAGRGTVALGGSNSLATVLVNEGTLNVLAMAALDAQLPAAVTVHSGARLNLNSSETYATPVVLAGGTLGGVGSGAYRTIHTGPVSLLADSAVAAAGTGYVLSLAGAISGGFALTKTDAGVVRITGGQNTYSGPTLIAAGTLAYRDGGTDGAGGGIIVGPSAVLEIDNTGIANLPDRIASVVTMRGGTLRLLGASSAGSSEAISLSVQRGMNLVAVTAVAGSQADLILSTLAVGRGASVDFAGGAVRLAEQPTGFIGPWATAGNDWAVHDAPGVRAMAAGEYHVGEQSTWTSSALHLRPSAEQMLTGNRVGATLNLTSGIVLNLGGHALRLGDGDGGIIKQGIVTSRMMGGNLTAGTADGAALYVHVADARTLEIGSATAGQQAAIVNNAGGAVSLVKSGRGTLRLANDSSYSGGTILNAGTLEVRSAGGLGTGTVQLSGGTLSVCSDVDRAFAFGADVVEDATIIAGRAGSSATGRSLSIGAVSVRGGRTVRISHSDAAIDYVLSVQTLAMEHGARLELDSRRNGLLIGAYAENGTPGIWTIRNGNSATMADALRHGVQFATTATVTAGIDGRSADPNVTLIGVRGAGNVLTLAGEIHVLDSGNTGGRLALAAHQSGMVVLAARASVLHRAGDRYQSMQLVGDGTGLVRFAAGFAGTASGNGGALACDQRGIADLSASGVDIETNSSGNLGSALSLNGTATWYVRTAAQTYTGTLAWNGTSAIHTDTDLALDGPVVLGGGAAVSKEGPGALSVGQLVAYQPASIHVAGGTLQLEGNLGRPASFEAGGSAHVSLAVRAGSVWLHAEQDIASVTSAVAGGIDLRGRIIRVYDSGAETAINVMVAGQRLIDSTSAAGLAIGITDRAWDAAGAQHVRVRLTRSGDANVDGVTNFADLLRLSQNYNTAGRLWDEADFNYDGVVNFSDLLRLSQNYNRAYPSKDDLAVPEPAAALVVLVCAGLTILRGRRADREIDSHVL